MDTFSIFVTPIVLYPLHRYKALKPYLSTTGSRIVNVTKVVGFHICILLPVEAIRLAAVSVSAVPLLIFMSSEYIMTDKTHYTEQYAGFLEHGGKDTVEQIAEKINIKDMMGKIY
jgi:hypothetical protein